MEHSEKIQVLHEMAEAAIERLRELIPPVVRVSGPLTSGGYGYDENLKRFKLAQEKLCEQGYTVFDYHEGKHDESHIVALQLPWQEVMEHYHRPIMETKLISTVFMMPKWRESNGATLEHEYAKRLGLIVRHIPANWFE